MQRRDFLKLSAVAAAAAACRPVAGPAPSLANATIDARPMPFAGTATPGMHHFGIWEKDDSFLYIPTTHRDDTPAPFLLMLHGAGGRASAFEAQNFVDRIESRGIVLCGISSSLATWDRFALKGFGPDVERLNLGLEYCFRHCNVDPDRVGIAGFSDGASYALTVGVPNGDLFKLIIAFSAGAFFSPGERGRPPIYVAHGTTDTVIPIANARSGFVPQLRDLGYTVTYREFNGGHVISGTAANEAFDMLVALSP